jgi:hypothetical protein
MEKVLTRYVLEFWVEGETYWKRSVNLHDTFKSAKYWVDNEAVDKNNVRIVKITHTIKECVVYEDSH